MVSTLLKDLRVYRKRKKEERGKEKERKITRKRREGDIPWVKLV